MWEHNKIKKCEYVHKDGKKCNSPALRGTAFCTWHSKKRPKHYAVSTKEQIHHTLQEQFSSSRTLSDIYADHLEVLDKSNLVSELASLRAVETKLTSHMSRCEIVSRADIKTLIALTDAIGKTVDRIGKVKSGRFDISALNVIINQIVNVVVDSISVCPYCSHDLTSLHRSVFEQLANINIPELNKDRVGSGVKGKTEYGPITVESELAKGRIINRKIMEETPCEIRPDSMEAHGLNNLIGEPLESRELNNLTEKSPISAPTEVLEMIESEPMADDSLYDSDFAAEVDKLI